MNILHGLSGSVASTIVHKFQTNYQNDTVKFVLTESSKKFGPHIYSFNLNQEIKAKSSWVKPHYLWYDKFDDENEWNVYDKEKGVLHIELMKWADVFVIAPCSANTLAKIANGICDNLLTCIARAWDFDKKIVIAPSMNTKMMSHPAYQNHIKTVQSWGIEIVPPQEKQLFCGDYGDGAMANIEDIVSRMKSK